MNLLSFASPAVVLGLLFFGIVPPFKEVTATHQQSAGDNTKDEELSINQEVGLKPAASMFLPTTPVVALNDHHYHVYSMNRKLDSYSCEDSPLKVLTTKKMKSAKTCAFISKKPKLRCKKDVIKSHCPNACKSCESFGTSDSKATFILEGDKTTCTWLHDLVTRSTLTKVSSWCQLDSLRATCRETCSFFCADGPEQSNMPSSSPSTSSSSSTSPTTSPSLSNPPSLSPTTCSDKITSIINEHFGDVTKGPPQEKAYTWLVDDITDDQCDDEVKILQRYILAVLYFSAGGEDWSHYMGYDFNWLESTNECDWLEVYCNDNQQVRTVALWGKNLRGTIPAELSSLTDLVHLYLGENNLSGSIPGSIFQLSKLAHLFLESNDLTGTIPDNFGGNTSLKMIYLSDNLLTGTIPDVTGDSLQSIGYLLLHSNKLSGPVPDSLCDLRSSKPNQFRYLRADCAPPDNAQNPCPSGCCTQCFEGKGLP